MSLKIIALKPVHFEEAVHKVKGKEPCNQFDILLEKEKHEFENESTFDQAYCSALVNQFIALDVNELDSFIYYHINEVVGPFYWLNQFQLLLVLNKEYVLSHSKALPYKYLTSIVCSMMRQYAMEEGTSLTELIELYLRNKYDIRMLSAVCDQMDSMDEKIRFLDKKIHEFLKDCPPYIECEKIHLFRQLGYELKDFEAQKKYQKITGTEKQLPFPNSQKVAFQTSVVNLATLHRIFYEAKMINPTEMYKTELFVWISNNYKTRHTDAISTNSIKNGFDSCDPKALLFWVEQLEELKIVAKQLLEKSRE